MFSPSTVGGLSLPITSFIWNQTKIQNESESPVPSLQTPKSAFACGYHLSVSFLFSSLSVDVHVQLQVGTWMQGPDSQMRRPVHLICLSKHAKSEHPPNQRPPKAPSPRLPFSKPGTTTGDGSDSQAAFQPPIQAREWDEPS
jgi:hypothetical protein